MSNFRTKQTRITVAGLAIIIHNYYLLQVSGTHSFYKIIVVTLQILTSRVNQYRTRSLREKSFTCWNAHIIFITNFITKRKRQARLTWLRWLTVNIYQR